MMDKCFDEGTIQAFLDGELASGLAEKVACHVAMCNNCAVALAVAEEESSFAFAALDLDLNALVPTERIRTRLFETISAEKQTFWQRIFGKGFSWNNAHIAAFASLVFVVTAFAVLFSVRENSTTIYVADKVPPVGSSKSDIASIPVNDSNGTIAQQPGESTVVTPPVERVNYQPRTEPRVRAQKAYYTEPVETRRPPVDVPPTVRAEYTIAGEETYVRTIDTLSKEVEQRKDELMRPSMRVAFEKDLAVVNDAIDKMKKEVRKNPRNQAAKEVLRSSYQNKIDLLNSVAEKNDLMATLDD